MLIQTSQSCFWVHLHARLTLLPEMPFLDCSWDVLLWTSELENLQCRLLYFVKMKFNFNFILEKEGTGAGSQIWQTMQVVSKDCVEKAKKLTWF